MISKPFRPFPQLWAAFGNKTMDAVVLRKGIDFEMLQEACKALVMQGKSAAEAKLGLNIPNRG